MRQASEDKRLTAETASQESEHVEWAARGGNQRAKAKGKQLERQDRRAKTKSDSRRSKTGWRELHGNTEKLSCMFILSCSSVCPPIFLCTVYYFVVVPTPVSCYTRESTASTCHITRVLITRHTQLIPLLHAWICYLTCDLDVNMAKSDPRLSQISSTHRVTLVVRNI